MCFSHTFYNSRYKNTRLWEGKRRQEENIELDGIGMLETLFSLKFGQAFFKSFFVFLQPMTTTTTT